MALGQRQELRQSQSLVMTPQLQQAIKLLQLTNLELSEYVEQELERNPLLERLEGDKPERGDGASEAPAPKDDGNDNRDTAELSRTEGLPGENESPLDVDDRDIYVDSSPADDGGPPASAMDYGRPAGNESANTLDQTVSGETSLVEHLLHQLNVEIDDPIDRLIGFHLIQSVDEAGYVTAELPALAQQVGCEETQVEATLKRLQAFDPSGVCARSLRECLAIQLRDRNRFDPAMAALLENLDLIAARNQEALLIKCGVDAEDLGDMIRELRALDPKPGLAFHHEIAQTLIPDVFVRAAPGGGWAVELNSETLPRVLVNQRYYTEVNRHASSKSDKTYLVEQFNAANWLVKSLEQRANTILKVATELVRQQDGFFAHGVQHLRPLTLRDIATEIGMHESTVSRVTANKYMATARGTYQMKYFFTSAITSASGGDSLSAESVRHRIKDLIDAEKADDILSDDRLVEILRGENIDIARRTVAKYREALRIPSSVDRRRLKKTQSWESR